MKPLAINFAWQRHDWRRRGGYTMLAFALLAAIGSGGWYAQLRDEQERWHTDWRRLDGQLSVKPAALSADDQEHRKTELAYANQVIDRLDTPWEALFGAVDAAYSDQATLIGIEPDSELHQVRLTAEAKGLPEMLAYFNQVRLSPVLQDVYLSSHQINLQDAQHPVRFTIDARWVDAPAVTIAAVTSPTSPTPVTAAAISAPAASPPGSAQ